MTIVHIEEAFHPAYGYQVQNFCRHHSAGHSVHVVTAKGLRSRFIKESEAALEKLDREFEAETGVTIHRLPTPLAWHHKMWLKGLHRTLEEIRPDAIFAHGVEYISFARVLRKRWDERCVVVTDSHDLPSAAHHGLLRRLYSLVQRWCVNAINRRGIRTYYTAPPTRDLLLSYGVRSEHLDYLPIGTSTDVYSRSEDERRALRAEWAVGEGDTVLLYTGKHDEDKSPHLLYEAAARVAPRPGSGLVVVSVGPREPGYFESRCRPALQKLEGLGVRSVQVDAVPAADLRGYYSAADVGVFPSRSTLSCLDAMACGLPVIMQDDTTNADRLREGGTVFPAGDLDALAAAIASYVADPDRCAAVGRAGCADVRERFDYGTIVRGLERDLESLVGAAAA